MLMLYGGTSWTACMFAFIFVGLADYLLNYSLRMFKKYNIFKFYRIQLRCRSTKSPAMLTNSFTMACLWCKALGYLSG